MLIVKTTTAEEEVKEVVSSLKSIITKMKGKIIDEKEMGRKELAYPIKKEVSGFYFVFNCEANPEAIAEFDRKAGLNENIIRHLIIRLDEE